MAIFESAYVYLHKREKGFSNNPKDKGGVTKDGISLRFLKGLPEDLQRRYKVYDGLKMGLDEEVIKNLSPEIIKQIFFEQFWEVAPFDKIGHQDIANYIFSMGCNMGINTAIKYVQRACWAIMKNRTLKDDGILGEKTLSAIKLCGFFLLPVLRAECANHYRSIAPVGDSDREFLEGWLNRAYS